MTNVAKTWIAVCCVLLCILFLILLAIIANNRRKSNMNLSFKVKIDEKGKTYVELIEYDGDFKKHPIKRFDLSNERHKEELKLYFKNAPSIFFSLITEADSMKDIFESQKKNNPKMIDNNNTNHVIIPFKTFAIKKNFGPKNKSTISIEVHDENGNIIKKETLNKNYIQNQERLTRKFDQFFKSMMNFTDDMVNLSDNMHNSINKEISDIKQLENNLDLQLNNDYYSYFINEQKGKNGNTNIYIHATLKPSSFDMEKYYKHNKPFTLYIKNFTNNNFDSINIQPDKEFLNFKITTYNKDNNKKLAIENSEGYKISIINGDGTKEIPLHGKSKITITNNGKTYFKSLDKEKLEYDDKDKKRIPINSTKIDLNDYINNKNATSIGIS